MRRETPMRKLELVLFLVILTIYSFFVQYPNVNQSTRFDLTRAIVEERTVTIDSYHENTVDKSFSNGHWYTDKAPGLSLLAAPVYAVLLALQPVSDAAVWPGYPLYVLNAFTVALPSALLVLLVWRWIRQATGNDNAAIAVAAAFGLGTLMLPFATLFFGHTTSAFFSFAAFYLLWRSALSSQPDEDGGEGRRLFLAGVLAGLGALVEYPTAAVAGLLLIYALSSARQRKTVIWYALGLLPALLAFAAYNMAAFGSPLSVSYLYSPNVASLGLSHVRMPTLQGLWTITFGPRGLFVLSPVLLLAAPGLIAMFRRPTLRREAVLFTLITAGMSTLAWFYYDTLGGVPGPRYLITCLPFAAAGIGLLLPRWRAPFAILAVVSVALSLLVTAANPLVPLTVANPLTERWLPAILERSIVPTTLFLRFGLRSALVLAAPGAMLAVGALAWLAWLKLKGQRQSTILTVCVVLAVIGYFAIGFPIDLLRPFTVPSVIVGVVP